MEIFDLLNHENKIYELWNQSDLNQLSFKILEYQIRESLSVNIIYTDKNQFLSEEHAFIALFKKIIFKNEEWDETENQAPIETWKRLVRFIKDSYMNNLSENEISEDDFWKRFNMDVLECGGSSIDVENFKSMNSNCRFHILHECGINLEAFGISNDICFIYDFFAVD